MAKGQAIQVTKLHHVDPSITVSPNNSILVKSAYPKPVKVMTTFELALTLLDRVVTL